MRRLYFTLLQIFLASAAFAGGAEVERDPQVKAKVTVTVTVTVREPKARDLGLDKEKFDAIIDGRPMPH